MRIHSDNTPEFRGLVITQFKETLSMKGTFTTPYRPQWNGLCERMNQMIESTNTWDKSLDLVTMAYRATLQTSTGFTPNMLVTSKENNMPCDLIYGSPKSRGNLCNYDCYCTYVEDLRNLMVGGYFNARQCLGEAAIRQKIYYDRDTTPCHFKKGNWIIYWHKPTSMQPLSSGWTGPFVVTEKVSVVDYKIQLKPEGSSNVVHVDQLRLHPCHQERTNWTGDMSRREVKRIATRGTDPLRPRTTTVGMSIACQTSDTDPIIVESNNPTPKVTVHRSTRKKRRPIRLVYYLQI